MTRSESGDLGGAPRASGAADNWRRALGELALACAGSFPGDGAVRLRELNRLLALAPAQGLVHGLAHLDQDDLDTLILAGAVDQAALAMIGPDSGYLLSRGAGGQHLASIMLPGGTEETSASGDSLALAVTGALALALSEAGTNPAIAPTATLTDRRLN